MQFACTVRCWQYLWSVYRMWYEGWGGQQLSTDRHQLTVTAASDAVLTSATRGRTPTPKHLQLYNHCNLLETMQTSVLCVYQGSGMEVEVRCVVLLTSVAFFSACSSFSWASFRDSEYLSNSSSTPLSFFCRPRSSSSSYTHTQMNSNTALNIMQKTRLHNIHK